MNTRDVFNAIMKWLETGVAPNSTRAFLKVELPDKQVLAFRRIDMMGERCAAEFIKDPRVRIHYDPNWNVMDTIAELVATAEK